MAMRQPGRQGYVYGRNRDSTEDSLGQESLAPRRVGKRQEGWVRDLPINERLIETLIALKEKSRFTSLDDFVLVSRVGTPVNHDNVLVRRLGPITGQLGVPSITWQAFRRNYEVLTFEMRKPRNMPSHAIPINAMNLGERESSNRDLKKSA
jgi:hypothetical protein